MCTEQWFDITTEYELFSRNVENRTTISPMHFSTLRVFERSRKVNICFVSTFYLKQNLELSLKTYCLSAIDVKCLKNKNTETLLNQHYFKQWFSQKTKTKLPLLWYWFSMYLLNILLFIIFDNGFHFIENNQLNSTKYECYNITFCAQNNGMVKEYCSLNVAYVCMGCLLIIRLFSFINFIHIIYTILAHFKHNLNTPMGPKKPLTQGLIYLFMEFMASLTIILKRLSQLVS